MLDIYSFSIKDLEEYLISINEKSYVAKIIFEWLYKKRAKSFLDMTNISKELREKLSLKFQLKNLEIAQKQISSDACKYLLELDDHNKIEAVLMLHNYGNSLCISSQIGCEMNCAFCASGKLKCLRNLTAGEMVRQILTIEKDSGLKINSVVMMGIGEPLLNYDNVLKCINIINDPKGLELGARHITISTCGIIPGIIKLKKEKLQINLALSLHAPNDNIRQKLMPINKVYSISKIMKEIKDYINVTNRRVTIEYVMIMGINDDEKCALELVKLLKGLNVYVNLIPYNEVRENDYKRSSQEQIMKFYDILKKNHINVTVRREFGKEIEGACGQLRRGEEI